VRFTYSRNVIRIIRAGYWKKGKKITISLSKENVEFFKKEATKHNTQYQKMMKETVAEPVPALIPEEARMLVSGDK